MHLQLTALRLGGWFGEFGGQDLEPWSKVSLEEALGAEALLRYVVSSTLEDPEWTNVTVLTGDVVDEVTEPASAFLTYQIVRDA